MTSKAKKIELHIPAVPGLARRGLTSTAELLEELKLLKSQVAAIEKELNGRIIPVETAILHKLSEQELTSVRTASGRNCTRSESSVPTLFDWERFIAHVLRTKNTALLHRQVNKTTARAMWDEGIDIPGVKKFDKVSLSFTKGRK